MTDGEREAYRAGYKACKSDIPMHACPDEYQARLRYAWEDGWQKAYKTRGW